MRLRKRGEAQSEAHFRAGGARGSSRKQAAPRNRSSELRNDDDPTTKGTAKHLGPDQKAER